MDLLRKKLDDLLGPPPSSESSSVTVEGSGTSGTPGSASRPRQSINLDSASRDDLVELVRNLYQKLEVARRKFHEKNELCIEYEKQITHLKTTIRDMLAKTEPSTDVIDRTSELEDEISALKAKQLEWKDKVKALLAEKDEQIERYKAWEEKCAKLEQFCDCLHNTVENNPATACTVPLPVSWLDETLLSNIEQNETGLVELKTSVSACDQLNNSWSSYVKQLSSEMKFHERQFAQQLNDRDDTVSELEGALKENEDTIRELETKCKKLQSDKQIAVDRVKQLEKDVSDARKLYDQATSQNQVLSAQIDSLTAECDALKLVRVDSSPACRHAEDRLDQDKELSKASPVFSPGRLHHELSSLRLLASERQVAVDILQGQLSDAHRCLEERMIAFANMEVDCAALRLLVQEKDQAIEDRADRTEAATQTVDEQNPSPLKELDEQLAAAKREIADLDSRRLQEVSSLSEVHDRMLVRKDAEMMDLKESLSSKLQQLQFDCQKYMDSATKTRVELDEAVLEKVTVVDLLRLCEDKLRKCCEDRQTLDTRVIDLEVLLSQHVRSIEDLTTSVTVKDREILELRSELGALRQASERMHDNEETLQHLSGQLQETHERCRTLTEQNHQLICEIEAMKISSHDALLRHTEERVALQTAIHELEEAHMARTQATADSAILDTLRHDLNSVKAEKDSLVCSFGEKLAQAEADAELLRLHAAGVEEELTAMRKARAELEKQFESLREDHVLLTSEKETLVVQLRDVRAVSADLETEKAALTAAAEKQLTDFSTKLTAERSAMSDRIQLLQNQCAENAAIIERLSSSNAAFERDVVSSRRMADETAHAKAQIEEVCKDLWQQNKDLTNQLDECRLRFKALENETVSQTALVNTLRGQVSDLTSSLDRSAKEVSDSGISLSAAESRLSDVMTSEQALKVELEALRSEHAISCSRADEQKLQISLLKDELRDIDSERTRLCESLDVCEAGKRDLMAQVDSLSAQLTDSQRLMEVVVGKHNDECEDLRRRLRKAYEEKERFRQKVLGAATQHVEVQTESCGVESMDDFRAEAKPEMSVSSASAAASIAKSASGIVGRTPRIAGADNKEGADRDDWLLVYAQRQAEKENEITGLKRELILVRRQLQGLEAIKREQESVIRDLRKRLGIGDDERVFSLEYLKNVVAKYMSTSTAEADGRAEMARVIASLLDFSAEERGRIPELSTGPTVVAGISDWFRSWTQP